MFCYRMAPSVHEASEYIPFLNQTIKCTSLKPKQFRINNAIIFWHVDPLLDDDLEISINTTAVTE
jgi:hypothetical protein